MPTSSQIPPFLPCHALQCMLWPVFDCDVRVLWLLKLTCIENNSTTYYSGVIARRNHKPKSSLIFRWKRGGVKGLFFGRKSKISLKRCDTEQNLQQSVGINLHITYLLVTYDDVIWPLGEFKVISSRRFQRLSVSSVTYYISRESWTTRNV